MPEYHRVGKKYTQGDTLKDERPPKAGEPVAEVTVSNVGRYLSAEASLMLTGPVPDEVFEARKAQCIGCPSRVLSDQLPDEIGYCRSCGCGVSERSRLTVKLTMPASTCPMNKWGASEGRHRSVVDRAKSWVARKIIGA
jgi:hypothetical protein